MASQLCFMMIDILLSTGLTSLASLLYITQIFQFTPALVIPALVIIAVTVIFSIATALTQTRIQRKRMEQSARE